MLNRSLAFAFVLVLLTASRFSSAATVTVSLDRWMYPFAATGGTRDLAPTFSAVGTPGFDNRDAQFIVGFDTSSQIPVGQGAANYQISTATVRFMVGSPSGFEYDPSYDSFRTYLLTTDPNYVSDSDAGRPIELHGIGFRNGHTQLSFTANDNQPPGFEESSSFGVPGVGTRNAYPLGFLSPGIGSDIANNITGGTESHPWAIGTASLVAGAAVPDNTMFSFAIDLSSADVRSYLQQGLNQGVLGFALTSLHTASQTGGPPVPQFITRENTRAGSAPAILEFEVQTVPEPTSLARCAVCWPRFR